MSTRRGPKPATAPPPKRGLLMLDESTWGPDDENLLDVPPPRRALVTLLRALGVVLALAACALAWVVFLTPPAEPVARVGPGEEAEEAMVTPLLVEPSVITLPQPAAPPSRTRPAAAPPTGFLVVSATPWAELYVDGRLVGNTPVVDLPVAAGTHTLRLVREGFVAEERVVSIVRGQTLRVTGIKLQVSRL